MSSPDRPASAASQDGSTTPPLEAGGLVNHALPPTAAEIRFYQTASGPDYEPMLDATRAVHEAYCVANCCTYRGFRGVRRGAHPWQASYNRIEELHDLLSAGFRGWFAYLDADAAVVQPGFDLRRYLGKRAAAALIAAPGGPEKWNINDGVFFLNLGHALGQEIVARWHASFHRNVTPDMLRDAVLPWQKLPDGRNFPDDQHLLQMELRRDERLLAALLVDDSGLIRASRGRFVRQFMRVGGSAAERLAALREATSSASG